MDGTCNTEVYPHMEVGLTHRKAYGFGMGHYI